MPKINFSDTSIAFAGKSNGDLIWARRMFSMIQYPIFVKVGKVLLHIAFFLRIPVAWILKKTLYRHFVGGETLDKCTATMDSLGAFNVKSILDYSVEGAQSEAEFDAVLEETARTIIMASENQNIAFAVFKPSALIHPSILKKKGFDKIPLSEKEDHAYSNFRQRVNTLCKLAFDKNVRLLVDAEDVWYQEAIDNIILEMMKKYNHHRAIVWNTWQMYRVDRLDNLKAAITKARRDDFYIGAKFVRGAYMEAERKRAKNGNYPSPIHINKEDTDKSFNTAIEVAIENIATCEIFCGTHNEQSTQLLCDLMEEEKIEKNDQRIWFAQLYGMGDHISFNLAHNGYNVTKYIPYGPVKSVAPYLIRRAEENTMIKGQTVRELSLLSQETKRRKQKL